VRIAWVSAVRVKVASDASNRLAARRGRDDPKPSRGAFDFQGARGTDRRCADRCGDDRAPRRGTAASRTRQRGRNALHPGRNVPFQNEDAVQTAPTGAFAFIPRGTPHTWQNVGDAPARLLAIFTPVAAGMERFFERFAELPEDEMGLEAFRRLASEADTEVVGPPLAASHPL
jgi:hypothetical protein